MVGDHIGGHVLDDRADAGLARRDALPQGFGPAQQAGMRLPVLAQTVVHALLQDQFLIREMGAHRVEQGGERRFEPVRVRANLQGAAQQDVGVPEQFTMLGVDARLARFIGLAPRQLQARRAAVAGPAIGIAGARDDHAVAATFLGFVQRHVRPPRR